MATVKKSERTFWHREATTILHTLRTSRRVTYKELSRKLEALGEIEPEKTLSNKINRGTFSFMFFLKCMYALGPSDVRFLLAPLSPDDMAAFRKRAETLKKRAFPRKRPVKVAGTTTTGRTPRR